MSEKPDRKEFLRSPSDYSTLELSMFAHEILTRARDSEPYNNRLSVSWDTEESLVYLLCHDTEKEYPNYQMNISSKTSIESEERIYMFNENFQFVNLYQVNLRNNKSYPVEVSNPFELTIEAMHHLRSRPDVYPGEPQNNRETENEFRIIMAELAIDTAIRDGVLDIQKFIGRKQFSEDHVAAIDTVLSMGVELNDDQKFPYTRSSRLTSVSIGQRVSQVTPRQIENNPT